MSLEQAIKDLTTEVQKLTAAMAGGLTSIGPGTENPAAKAEADTAGKRTRRTKAQIEADAKAAAAPKTEEQESLDLDADTGSLDTDNDLDLDSLEFNEQLDQEPEPEVVVDRKTVHATLLQVAKKKGKEQAFALMKKYGGAPFDNIKDEFMGKLMADAEAALKS